MANQPVIRQSGVIAVRNGQVCLVSSRNGKRWVVPKGCIEPGKSAGEIALQEAWEEAGLVGLLQGEPLGSYVYEKDGFVCHVILFAMNVTGVVDAYPEAGMRQRIWLAPAVAHTRVEDAGLGDILRNNPLTRAG
jgi:8-oxo-dGTP pyrophosphatase MutT (NUDIX family)